MALTQINAQGSGPQPQKSKLDTFASVLGMGNQLGSVGLQAYNTFNPKPDVPSGSSGNASQGPSLSGLPNPKSLGTSMVAGYQNNFGR